MAANQTDAIGTGTPQSEDSGAAFPRFEQTFPKLTDAEIERMRRFGEVRGYKDGTLLFESGKVGPGP